MNDRKLSSRIFTVLIFLLFVLITKSYWLPKLLFYLETNSDTIQSVDAFLNIVSRIIEVTLLLLGISLGNKYLKNRQENVTFTEESPLSQVTIDELYSRLGEHEKEIPWVDRGILTQKQLRQGGLVLVSGQMKVGKTREALELIRICIDENIIPAHRIFQPNPRLILSDPERIRELIFNSIDFQEPILLFVDDLPFHFFGERLSLLQEAIEVLKESKEFYIVATAQDDQLKAEHNAWLHSLKFKNVHLPEMNSIQMGGFVEGAVNSFGFTLVESAKKIIIANSNGIPEIVLIGFRRLKSQRVRLITNQIAQETITDSLKASWEKTRRYLQNKNPAIKYIFAAMEIFTSSRITSYLSLIVDYSEFLLKKDTKWYRIQNNRKIIVDTLSALVSMGGFITSNDIIIPGINIEVSHNINEAQDILGEFLLHRTKFFELPLIKLFANDQGKQNKVQCLTELAVNAMDKGNFELALKYYSCAIKTSNDPLLYLNRGSIFGYRKELDKGIRDFSKAIDYSLDGTLKLHALYNRSLAFLEKKKFDKSLNDAKTALAMNPNHPEGHKNIGVIHFNLKEYKKAKDELSIAIEQLPDGLNKGFASFIRGLANGELDDIDAAIKDFSITIHKFRQIAEKGEGIRGSWRTMPITLDLAEVFYQRACLNEKNRDFTNAISDFISSIKINPSHFGAHLMLAKTYKDLGNFEKMMEIVNNATKIWPKSEVFYLLKAEIFVEQTLYDAALREINKALSFSTNIRSKSNVYARRATLHARAGNTKKAFSDFRRAIILAPSNGNTYFNRAMLYEQLRQFRKMEVNLTKALKYNPDNVDIPRILVKRGSAYDELGHFELALKDFNDSIKLNSQSEIAHQNKGVTLFRMGKLGDAIKEFNTTLSINKKTIEAYVMRAQCFAQKGEISRGLRDVNYAFQLSPSKETKAGLYRTRGVLNFSDERYLTATKDFSNAEALYTNTIDKVYCMVMRARCFLLLHNLKDAENAISIALRLTPNNPEALYLRGNMLKNNQNYEKAILSFTECLKGLPPNNDLTAKVLLDRGNTFLSLGKYYQCILDISSLLRHIPINNEILQLRGTVFMELGALEYAIRDFQQAKLLLPSFIPARNDLGILLMYQESYQDAIDECDYIIQNSHEISEKARAYRIKSTCLMRQKQFDDAITEYKISANLSPEHHQQYKVEAELALLVGDYKKALSLYAEVRNLISDKNFYQYYIAIVHLIFEKDDLEINRIKLLLNKSDMHILNLIDYLQFLTTLKKIDPDLPYMDQLIKDLRVSIGRERIRNFPKEFILKILAGKKA